jgi:hypothetical protein
MQNAANGGVVIEPKNRNKYRNKDGNEDRDDAFHSIVSDLVSLIGHVQASLTLVEQAIFRETLVGSQETSANVIVLDDVTPPYTRATAALKACDASLAIALRCLLDSRVSARDTSDYSARSPALSSVCG